MYKFLVQKLKIREEREIIAESLNPKDYASIEITS